MNIERLKQLIMQYKESMSYYHDAKMLTMRQNVAMNILVRCWNVLVGMYIIKKENCLNIKRL